MNVQSETVDFDERLSGVRGPIGSLAFGLLTGPTAWFVQLCAGYGLSSWPCFPTDERRLMPLEHYGWTSSAVLLVSVTSLILSLIACLTARRLYRTAQLHSHPLTPASTRNLVVAAIVGRTRFLAMWGIVSGAAFAIAIAFTGLALAVLPRCAG
jgi:hypothetical protein